MHARCFSTLPNNETLSAWHAEACFKEENCSSPHTSTAKKLRALYCIQLVMDTSTYACTYSQVFPERHCAREGFLFQASASK